MILTQCAVCATDLGLIFGRCSTRTPAECHVRMERHDQLCRAQAAPAPQPNKKDAEGRRVAAKVRGRCHIARRRSTGTKEGLVRMCACRGTAGSRMCRVWQSQDLVPRRRRRTINQNIQWWRVPVQLVRATASRLGVRPGGRISPSPLGSAGDGRIWRTAISVLGNGLSSARHDEDTFLAERGELAVMRRLGGSEETSVADLSCEHAHLGRIEQPHRWSEMYTADV